ncbi:hypothetical protein BCR32DRAFT_236712 [Anaeromyces robustus]|uniref:SUEL-type lectin domain-containing protein n=1 Tax=Anaeromyces robustus TaxID=1754192 RepID=A0A1Y1WRS2_9FUNG|nr:hypothetical protein BCR32DRAFT_236712 [Anaeromyces robustus]|eukprot:ORX76243.1 hypothetical protein BCR32DRAFT_236712 [Anaeromyces robustus]
MKNFENDNFNEDRDKDRKKLSKLQQIIERKSEYFCELYKSLPSLSYKGYNITCPIYYTISIDHAYYGRYANDSQHCKIDYEGKEVPTRNLIYPYDCGSNIIDEIKELCEGKRHCILKPHNSYYRYICNSLYKYLHVKYHCVKDLTIKKPKIRIVMFANKINVNSVFENAISEFYQYSKIHEYEFRLHKLRYDTEREIFYMKTESIIENLIIGLKEKTFDWILWVDSDFVIINPNIKLETFLPTNDMDNIHLIASDDFNGLNAGIFFLRVHPWSLNLLMRVMSYSYYNIQKPLEFEDQTALNNVLVESKDDEEHYIIVPQDWFNSYLSNKEKESFLIHLAGESNKNWKAYFLRNENINNNGKYYIKNKELRKKVLKYYKLPKEKQHKLEYQ